MRKLPWVEILISDKENLKHENTTQDKARCFVFIKNTSVITKPIVIWIPRAQHYVKHIILTTSFKYTKKKSYTGIIITSKLLGEYKTGPSFAKNSQEGFNSEDWRTMKLWLLQHRNKFKIHKAKFILKNHYQELPRWCSG